MTRLIVIGSADDIDVTHGFRMLLKQKTITEVYLPAAEDNETHDQIIMAAAENGIPVNQGSSLEELLLSSTKEDVIALAWDESDECFEAVLSAGEKGIELWDISDGLNIVDMETEILEERLEEVLVDFTDTLVAIVYKMVMDQVDEKGKRKYRRSE